MLIAYWWPGRSVAEMTAYPLIVSGIAALDIPAASRRCNFACHKYGLSREGVAAALYLTFGALGYAALWLIFGSTLSLGGHLMGWGFLLVGTAIGRFR